MYNEDDLFEEEVETFLEPEEVLDLSLPPKFTTLDLIAIHKLIKAGFTAEDFNQR